MGQTHLLHPSLNSRRIYSYLITILSMTALPHSITKIIRSHSYTNIKFWRIMCNVSSTLNNAQISETQVAKALN